MVGRVSFISWRFFSKIIADFWVFLKLCRTAQLLSMADYQFFSGSMSLPTFQFMSPLASLIFVLVLYLHCIVVSIGTNGIFPEVFRPSVSYR